MAKWLSEEWIKDSLDGCELQVRKELLEVAKEIDKVKDKKSLIAFAEKVVAIKNLTNDEKLVVAMLDPLLVSKGEKYIEDLKNRNFEKGFLKPFIYLNTIGEDRAEEIIQQRILEEQEKKNKDKKPDDSSSETTTEPTSETTETEDKKDK